MKKLSYILFLTMSFLVDCPLSAQESQREEIEPEMSHLSLGGNSLDLGTLARDATAEGIMSFRNTGKAPLEIFSIFTDCGCTTTSYPHDPIGAGEEGEIKIRFNSKGRQPGPFRKVLRVRSNADNQRVSIIVKGEIE